MLINVVRMSDWDQIAAKVKDGVAADLDAARERMLAASRVRAEVEQVQGIAEVEGVRAAVDSSGRLLSLELDDSFGGAAAARIIMKAVGDAHRQAVDKVAGVAEREFGADSEFVARIRGEAEARIVPAPDPGSDPDAGQVAGGPAGRVPTLRPGGSAVIRPGGQW
jgi:hypothetical protein